MFLVKKGCTSVIKGEIDVDAQSGSEGFEWVVGARKKDIEWDMMKTIKTKNAQKQFYKLSEWFSNGILPESPHLLSLTEEGIFSWGDLTYKSGETLEEYFEHHELGPDCKYPVNIYSYIENGEYFSQGDMCLFGMSVSDKPKTEWRKMTQDYIDRISEDNVLIPVYCHI
ncbi:MAG: hypothetical protein LBS36_04235 [Oscillospiraceae bacterium]|nr:hypothetical protein [Oscillospiraceae bacterium]